MTAVESLKAGFDRLSSTLPLGSGQGDQPSSLPITAKAGSPAALRPDDPALRVRTARTVIDVLPVVGDRPDTWVGVHRTGWSSIERVELASATIVSLLEIYDHEIRSAGGTDAWALIGGSSIQTGP